jgi:hypothetical protein
MPEETKYEIQAAQEDLGNLVESFINLKENIANIDCITEDAKDSLQKASEELNKVLQSIAKQIEQQELDESEAEEPREGDTSLTKDDKNMPDVKAGETFEAWMTRCMWDTNARSLYPEDQTRFQACMLKGKGEDFRDS